MNAPANGTQPTTLADAAKLLGELVEMAAEAAPGEPGLLLRQRLTALSGQFAEAAQSSPGSRGSFSRGNGPEFPGSPALRPEPDEGGGEKGSKNGPKVPSLPFEILAAFLARAAALPTPTWLLEKLVPELGRLLIVAPPNAGKTYLCLVIAKVAALAGRLVYLVLEEGNPKALAQRFSDLGFTAAEPVHVLHQTGFTLFEHALALEAMLKAGTSGPAPVVVLDPFAAVFAGDENDTEQMNAARAVLDRFCRADPRALLVVPHHSSKAGANGEVGDAMYASRGSSVLPAWADFQLILKHVEVAVNSGRVEFDATVRKNRDGPRDYTSRVAIELGSGEVTMQALAEAKADDKRKAKKTEIVAFVENADGPMGKTAIYDGVGGKKERTFELIEELHREGVLANDGAGFTLAKREGGTP